MGLNVLSLFSGIGAFEKALKRQEIEYNLANFCEIDKYASKAYSILHDEPAEKNLGDITKVVAENLPDFDLMTWGFPCQDISIAGNQKGIIEGETRSGLYYEGFRILEAKRPKYSIIENVKALTQKKFAAQFKQILSAIEVLGYINYWQVLNAKDYGVPQNRERVFIVSIRQDVHTGFEFPIGFDSGMRLRDILEDEVDEKYYLSDERTQTLLHQLKGKEGITAGVYNQNDGFREKEYSTTIDANYYKGLGSNQDKPAVIKVGNTHPSGNGMNGCVYDVDGLAPTVTTNKGEGSKIAIPVLTPDRMEKRQNGRRFKEDGEPMFSLTTQDRHGVCVVGRIDIKGDDYIKRVYSPDGISPCLPTMQGGSQEPKIIEDFYSNRDMREYEDYSPTLRADRQGLKVATQYRIRKLVPLECYRLMDFDDLDYWALKQHGISDTQLYKMAGNSIVVAVLEGILKNLFKKERQLTFLEKIRRNSNETKCIMQEA